MFRVFGRLSFSQALAIGATSCAFAASARKNDAVKCAVSDKAAFGVERASAPIRIVSYNVLSSHLCSPSHFQACEPANLEPATRLERVKAQLESQMQNDAILCLQEVSTDWAGELTPFFEKRGYTLVTGLYGSRFNGYMGVALAWPSSRFESEAVEMVRPADTKVWPELPKPSRPFFSRLWQCVTSRGEPKRPVEFNPLHEAATRKNILLSARLRCGAVLCEPDCMPSYTICLPFLSLPHLTLL